jgi:hypothetical protein
MKIIAPAIAAIGLLASTPAFAAAVSLTFQNVGTVQMTVSKVSPCGVFFTYARIGSCWKDFTKIYRDLLSWR